MSPFPPWCRKCTRVEVTRQRRFALAMKKAARRVGLLWARCHCIDGLAAPLTGCRSRPPLRSFFPLQDSAVLRQPAALALV